MRKPAAHIVHSMRPIWRKNILCHAIALAGVSLQTSAALAASCAAPPNLTSTCTITGGQSVDVASDGSLIVPDADAIVITGAGAKSITNLGEIEGTPIAIRADPAATGNITIEPYAPALILGVSAGVWINSGSSVTLTNQGTIEARSSTSAAAIHFSGDLNGSIVDNNGGTFKAESDASLTDANAYGIYVGGALHGTISNDSPGTITATASAGSTATFSESAHAAAIYINAGAVAGSRIINHGIISANAAALSANGDAGATAIHMGVGTSEGGNAFSIAGSLTNFGTITAASTSSGGNADAFGVHLNGSMVGANITNCSAVVSTACPAGTPGHITATAFGASADATAIYIGATVDAQSALTNAGTIAADATAAQGFAGANGVYIFGHLDGSLVSTGTIDAAAAGGASKATAFGVYVGSIVTSTGTLTNGGQIVVSADARTFARAAGVFVNNEVDGSVVSNSGGAITATAVAQSGTAFASGLQMTGGPLTGSLTNSGVISVTASNTVAGFTWASGIGVSSEIADGGSLINSNRIVAIAGGGSASIAAGIVVNSVQPGGSVTNSGTIDVTIGGVGGAWSSSGHLAVGIFVGDFAGATLLNSGTITTNTAAGPGTGWAIIAGVESADGSAIVRNSGALRGNVHLEGTSMINTGLLSIPISDGAANLSSFVGGNYTQSGNGVLEIGAFSKDLYGRIEVTGTADLTASGRLAVNVSSNDALVRGERLDNVLHAGNLMSGGNTNLFVADNSPFWSFTALDDGKNGIDLVVSGQTVPVMTAQSSQVANLTLDELSGLVMGRMDARRLINVRGSHDQNLWFRPFGTSGSQDDANDVPGYDIDTYGVAIGYDAAVSPEWNAGAAFAYAKSNVKSNSSQFDDKIDCDTYAGSVYAYWSGAGGTFIDLLAIGGRSSNDSTRNVGVVGNADGNYDSWFTRLSSAIGRGFAINDRLTVSPIASVTYTYVNEDSYTESGTSGLNLEVDSSNAKSLIFGLDGQLAYRVGEGSLLTAHVGGGFDALTDDVTVTANFVGGGPSFETKGAKPDEWLVRAGVGAEMVVSDRVEVHINYEYEYRDTFDNNLLMATLRWRI